MKNDLSDAGQAARPGANPNTPLVPPARNEIRRTGTDGSAVEVLLAGLDAPWRITLDLAAGEGLSRPAHDQPPGGARHEQP